jgi:phosphoribosyl 1,2-cyclic phosphodiesterase
VFEKETIVGFWGVRGSTPTVERSNARYGGNTPCVELLAPDGTRFILDCGTGLRTLGNRWLAAHSDKPLEAHVFVTHYHWDHIQGIPFFGPLYGPKHKFHFYSFRSNFLGKESLKKVLEAQMAQPYFPVDMSVMSAHRDFSEIADKDTLEISGVKITARALNHPQGCLGFRFETPAGTVVYATDNEPGNPELDRSIRELAQGADIFINDAQYTPEQLSTTRKGWGHSSWLEGVNIAKEAGAKHLILFHHDPDSSDLIIDGLQREARQKFASVWAASEGMVMTMGQGKLNVLMRPTRTGQRRSVFFRATVSGYSEDGRAFEEKIVVRDVSLQGALLHLAHLPRLQSEVKVKIEMPIDENHPSGLVVLRGYVVRREPAPNVNHNYVGVVFTEENDPELPMR